MKLADPPLPKVLFRVLLGAFFVAAGITKAVQSADPAIGPGVHGFAEYLAAAGILLSALFFLWRPVPARR